MKSTKASHPQGFIVRPHLLQGKRLSGGQPTRFTTRHFCTTAYHRTVGNGEPLRNGSRFKHCLANCKSTIWQLKAKHKSAKAKKIGLRLYFNKATTLFTLQQMESRRISAKHKLLQMHFESRVGHIGGNLSALDILLCLYHDVMNEDDQFVLSKGHAAGALYVVLWTLNKLSDDDLRQFHQDGTLLSGHPAPSGVPGIIFATGSLGHGFGLASGLAHSNLIQMRSRRVFCLTSDGEWNEGSSWEALIYSAHRGFSNLVLIVDENGLQGFGKTREVANIEPISERFRSFGVTVLEVDGHDSNQLQKALQHVPQRGPLIVIAKTIKGCGVSFMENCVDWHYLPMSEDQYATALRELEKK